MTDSESRLHLADERIDLIQAVLDDVKKALAAAERAQEVAERAREDLRKVNLLVLACAVVVSVVVLLSRRKR